MAYKIIDKETGRFIVISDAQRSKTMNDLMLSEQDFASGLNGTHGKYTIIHKIETVD